MKIILVDGSMTDRSFRYHLIRRGMVGKWSFLSCLCAFIPRQQWRRNWRFEWHHFSTDSFSIHWSGWHLVVTNISKSFERFRLRHFKLPRNRSSVWFHEGFRTTSQTMQKARYKINFGFSPKCKYKSRCTNA